MIYTLTNSGGSNLDWTASAADPWLALSIEAGTLAPASSTNLTLALGSLAETLSAGVYKSSISFIGGGTTTVEIICSVALTVTNSEAPALLITNPQFVGEDFVFSFNTVQSQNYTVEYTDSLPPSMWTPLATVLGSGGVISFTNSNVAPTLRLYRVRGQ
jgi:hypothetical protein